MPSWTECENGSRIATCYHTPRCGPLRPGQAPGNRPFGRYTTDPCQEYRSEVNRRYVREQMERRFPEEQKRNDLAVAIA